MKNNFSSLASLEYPGGRHFYDMTRMGWLGVHGYLFLLLLTMVALLVFL